MKTLADIITMKDKIINSAEKLGFRNVRIFYGGADSSQKQKLEFIVEKIPEKPTSYKNATYLSVILAEEIECEVTVTPYENIENLYKDHFMNNSASLNDETAIYNLFKLATDKIQFKSPTDDEGTKKIREAVLKEAKEFVDKNFSHYTHSKLAFMPDIYSTEKLEGSNFEECGKKAFSENFKATKNFTEEDIRKFLEGFIKSAEEKGYDCNSILNSVHKENTNVKCQ